MSAAIMIQLNNSRFLCGAGAGAGASSLDIIFTRSHQQAGPAWTQHPSCGGAQGGPGGVTSPGSGSRSRGSQEDHLITSSAEQRPGRALAALIPLPGRQPRRSSQFRIQGEPREAGTGAASLLPRTTKKNVEVGAPLLCRALYGPQCPESSSYPLAPQSLKDRTVSWVCPTSEEVITCLPTNLEKLLSTQQKTSHVENGSV